MIRFLLLLLSLPVLAFSQGSTNDYLLSQKPASGPLVVRPVTPAVGKLLGWGSSINTPIAITLGTGLSLTGSTLNSTASTPAWGDITGIPAAITTLSSATAAGLALMDDADASAQRTTLGLGTLATQSGTLTDYLTTATAATTYQPLSATLTTLSSATAAGLALMDDADATAQRTTLGLGTLATQSGTFSGTSSGTNTGDQTITLTGDVTGSGTGSFAATIANDAVTFAKMQEISGTHLMGRHGSGSGNIQEVSVGDGVEFQGSGIRRSALTGDVTASAGSNTLTLATVNSNVGSFGSATAAPAVTVNAKGLVTAVTTNTITPAVGSITGLGTGVSTFLGTPTLANLNTAVSDADLATTGANTFTGALTITQGTANTGILTSTGYSLTGSNATPMIDLAGTWNTSGTPTGIKLNITNTASNSASSLIDIQSGGTSRFRVLATGGTVLGGGASGPLSIVSSTGTVTFTATGDGSLLQDKSIVLPVGGYVRMGFTGGNDPIITGTSQNVTISGITTLQLGGNTATASATAVAQTIKGPNATGATSTGGSLTIAGGTGTSAGGAVIISTAATTTQATAVTVDKDGVTTFAKPPVLPVYTVATLPATAAAGMVQGAQAVVTDATAPTYLGALTGGGAIVCPVFYNGTAWVSH